MIFTVYQRRNSTPGLCAGLPLPSGSEQPGKCVLGVANEVRAGVVAPRFAVHGGLGSVLVVPCVAKRGPCPAGNRGDGADQPVGVRAGPASAYASIQFRALRQFFKWRADEEQSPDPMTRLRAPKVTVTAVPVFTSVELSGLDKACQGRSFAARRDAAIIAVFTATGIRLSELAGICCHPDDPARSDLDLHGRRSGSAARAGRPGPSRSAIRRPAAWTATCGPAPGTRSPGGPSCGSA